MFLDRVRGRRAAHLFAKGKMAARFLRASTAGARACGASLASCRVRPAAGIARAGRPMSYAVTLTGTNKSAYTLPAEAKAAYKRDGYIVIHNFLTEEEVAAIEVVYDKVRGCAAPSLRQTPPTHKGGVYTAALCAVCTRRNAHARG